MTKRFRTDKGAIEYLNECIDGILAERSLQWLEDADLSDLHRLYWVLSDCHFELVRCLKNTPEDTRNAVLDRMGALNERMEDLSMLLEHYEDPAYRESLRNRKEKLAYDEHGHKNTLAGAAGDESEEHPSERERSAD